MLPTYSWYMLNVFAAEQIKYREEEEGWREGKEMEGRKRDVEEE
jgi:hypothetical protein